MTTPSFKSSAIKSSTAKGNSKLKLHSRNPHRAPYNFPLLADSCPELSHFIIKNKFNNASIDFANPDAVKTLNRALLNHFYGIAFWDIPSGYLCPPIPSRADYIHYLADLLADSNGGVIPRGKSINVLDIGIGANCVYPIIGHQEYGWRFLGSDIDATAIEAANVIIKANSLSSAIQCRQQAKKEQVFSGIWPEQKRFDATLCNPPFHRSKAHMVEQVERKWQGLKQGQQQKESRLNFGGQSHELWCDGGEEGFIKRMIIESQQYGDQCYWFTCFVSKQSSLSGIYATLKRVRAEKVKTVNMAQGQKNSRFVAWTFLSSQQRDFWRDHHWQLDRG
ncbi:23S rRNA (adenine(1618)-N(6))-methyltransferase RlmF [Marinomonas agarivorans]|nr:23S rRNA (adenine(1618)-N(6))-methyltransferase RlmF [Marinomonas agarivorans]